MNYYLGTAIHNVCLFPKVCRVCEVGSSVRRGLGLNPSNYSAKSFGPSHCTVQVSSDQSVLKKEVITMLIIDERSISTL